MALIYLEMLVRTSHNAKMVVKGWLAGRSISLKKEVIQVILKNPGPFIRWKTCRSHARRPSAAAVRKIFTELTDQGILGSAVCW